MKKYLLSITACLMLFSTCTWVHPAYAQSGSSTCQVTASVRETTQPSGLENGEGEPGESEETDPGRESPEDTQPGEEQDKEPSEEPDRPGDENGEEPDEDVSTPEPVESEAVPESGEDGIPQEQGEEQKPMEGQEETPTETEPEPSQSPGPLQPDRESEKDRNLLWRFIVALMFLSVLAVLVATGAFNYFWMWLLFVFFRKSRRQFHGILTEEKSFFVHVRGAQDGSRLVQEIIDSVGSLAECKDEIMGEAAVTEIPRQSRMQVSYPGRDGRRHCKETEADEKALFRILGKLEGTGDVKVRIICRGTRINVSLWFHV